MGLFENVKKNVKKKWDSHQAEEARKGAIYKEAYKKAEVKELQNKAKRDAKARYAPQKKAKDKKGKNMLSEYENFMVK